VPEIRAGVTERDLGGHADAIERLYTFIYSGGGSRDFADAYRLFRGRDPDINGLLAKRGFAALQPLEDGAAT
jgi:peptidyl-dipeptidase Dcp